MLRPAWNEQGPAKDSGHPGHLGRGGRPLPARSSTRSTACAGSTAFSRVEVPVFEATEVFARSIGETTDVVSKEMYTFQDRGGDSLTLRPEFTAGICRAYLSRRLAAARAAEGRDPRPGVPLRAPAEGPLPPVPPARRRDHRRRRAGGRCRAARPGRPAAAASSASPTASRCSSTRWATPRRATPGARRWSRISRRIAATCPKTASPGSTRIRCASSTARIRATGRSPTARRRSTIS